MADVIVADPPFLSEECLTKVAKSIAFLTAKDIILCTGPSCFISLPVLFQLPYALFPSYSSLTSRFLLTLLAVSSGAVMGELATKLLKVNMLSWRPKHRKQLSNDFRCFTNFK
jgi:hypothetical protein